MRRVDANCLRGGVKCQPSSLVVIWKNMCFWSHVWTDFLFHSWLASELLCSRNMHQQLVVLTNDNGRGRTDLGEGPRMAERGRYRVVVGAGRVGRGKREREGQEERRKGWGRERGRG